MVDRVGQQLGNYRLMQLLGQGNWASVYLGEHGHLQTPAAIKVLHGSLAHGDVEGFLTEARTLAHLRHPHIVRVLDFGVQEGAPFLVMDYASGGTLRDRHSKGSRLLLETVVSYVKQVASALQYAHEQHLIHRDLKPENLLLGPDQELLLSDFGLAAVVHSARLQPSQPVAGTLAYMAPEQLAGHPTLASDQYALGIIVYEWLCGEPPFSGSLPELLVKQTQVSPPLLSEKGATIPEKVEQVVLQALAKDPQQRFASVQAFAVALEEAEREGASGQTLPMVAAQYATEAAYKIISLHSLPTGTVTLLFTDIEGATQLLYQLGERYAKMLSECRQLLRAICHEFRGHEVGMQGASFFVAFARATDAVAAAAAAQRALASHSWPEEVMVRVRMSLHTGEPSLSSEGYVGLDVHQAAWIMSAGHSGQTLLSETTCKLVEHDLPDGVSLRDLGVHRLKDLSRPTRLFQLVIAGLPADFPPLKTLDSHPNNLPIQATLLIGREQELAALIQLLQRQDVRLVTLVGPGGTGKTRLGLQAAAELSEHFADGVFFVNLAPTSDPARVLSIIAQTLGLREIVGQSMHQTVQEVLRPKQVLLLLDNFEQVISAALEVAELLTTCPQLTIIVTSRAALHVRGEHEFTVSPLVLPDLKHLPDLEALPHSAAVALFLERVQAVKPEFQLTNTNARTVAEICVRLDGLPLALELAAARIKLLPPQALLARLGQRLAILTSGTRDAPTRQQTLRNTLTWSYDLLDVQEQHLFQLLSVFEGGCTLEAIEEVYRGMGGETTEVLPLVASLIDKSLLQQTEQKSSIPRFVLLETIREYVLECLVASGEREEVRRAHAMYYLRFAEEAVPNVYYLRFAEEVVPNITGSEQAVLLKQLEYEHENLRGGQRWIVERGEEEIALRLSWALLRFWVARQLSEGQHFVEKVLLMGNPKTPKLLRGKALTVLGMLFWFQGEYDQAEVRFRESLQVCQAFEDQQGIAYALSGLARVAFAKHDYRRAGTLVGETLGVLRELGDRWGTAHALEVLARITFAQEENIRASQLLTESLTLFKQVGDRESEALILIYLARMLVKQGDLVTARPLLEEALALCKEEEQRWGIAYALECFGQLVLQQGDIPRANTLLRESLLFHREMGDRRSIARSLLLVANVAALQGDYVVARPLYEESLEIAAVLKHKGLMASCLEGLGGVVSMQGQLAWAAQLWGAAEALRETSGQLRPHAAQAIYEQVVALARTQLGKEAFATAWAQGRTLVAEQAFPMQMLAAIPIASASELPSSPPVSSPASYPAGLTAREVEVLRLVAQGLTDAQIAQQLVISPRTVNWHLTSIYSKLQVTSRSAATRYALEHHLI